MYCSKWFTAILMVVCVAAVSFSQAPGENKGDGGKETTVETDAIFDDIIQSLPGQLRAEVDSAKQAGAASAQAPDAEAVQKRTEEQEQLRQEALDELPEKVRNQVEKAIDDMDENLQERQLQFKEQKGKMKGNK